MQIQTLDSRDQAPPQTQDMHSIHLVTAEIGEAGGQAYNYLVFRDHTGADKVMMNGLVFPRQSSEIRALRGVMAPPNESGLPQDHFNEVISVEIFRGNVKEYLKKMAIGAEALKFINEQNLNYRPEDPLSDTPNSIAHALIKAMELEFPEQAIHFWAPGHENIILPENWRSKHAKH